MKVKVEKEETKFTPININLTIESKAEYDALFSVVNYSLKVAECIREMEALTVLDASRINNVLLEIFNEMHKFSKK